MRSTLLLSVALTFGFLTFTFTACGTASKCSSTTCPSGCCDSSGLCQTTGSSSACGSRGVACAVCGVTASCVAGSCMQNISGSGGGTSGVGGGTSGTGGGTSGAGGGTSGTGGGTSGTGGGTSGTGGGASGTGGGSSGTGGGSSGGEAATFCARLGAAMTRFFAGRSTCGSGGLTLSNNFNSVACVDGYPSCSTFDKQALTSGTACIETATICSSGNDTAAISSISSCLATISDISPTCATAMGFN